MAHKTIALTTELREQLVVVSAVSFRSRRQLIFEMHDHCPRLVA